METKLSQDSKFQELEKKWEGLEVVRCDFPVHDEVIRRLIWYDNDTKFVTCSHDDSLKFWDAKSHELIDDIPDAHESRIFNIILKDEFTLLSAGEDELINIWDLKLRKKIRYLRGHKDFVYQMLLFGAKNDILVSGGGDRIFCFWNLLDQYDSPLIKQIHDVTGDILCLIKLSKNRVCAALEHKVLVYMVEGTDQFDGEKIAMNVEIRFEDHVDAVRDIQTLNYKGEEAIITASWDKTCKLFGLTQKTCLRTYNLIDYGYSICLLDDGLFFAASDYEGVIRIFNTETGKIVRQLEADYQVFPWKGRKDGFISIGKRWAFYWLTYNQQDKDEADSDNFQENIIKDEWP